MSKHIMVIMPDHYKVENAISRIRAELSDEHIVVIEAKDDVSGEIGKVLLLVNEFQQKLKGLASPTEGGDNDH